MRYIVFILFVVLATSVSAQETPDSSRMTQDHLHDLILDVGSNVIISGNLVRFAYDGAELLCISDVTADRMRILSPVAELTEVGSEQILLALAANFHTVLDARYALSDGMVYSAFIHPLSSLTDEELFSAIAQVATARNTFGDGYSSGALIFGGRAAP